LPVGKPVALLPRKSPNPSSFTGDCAGISVVLKETKMTVTCTRKLKSLPLVLQPKTLFITRVYLRLEKGTMLARNKML